ncbi:protein PHOSPHATE STARVATION RESPONSE 3-like [Impatiens glandulifera]|uniref:protein PHOSPHATE STARVATION RESPONSE 3-like n=1 Tax=Impatiens glandulifera TaxID=253017 RepID=UPI001FB0FD65|nr:protein PHOSPHATE STARVATION RESPONSE 3-like [Impatiens glandulifera]
MQHQLQQQQHDLTRIISQTWEEEEEHQHHHHPLILSSSSSHNPPAAYNNNNNPISNEMLELWLENPTSVHWQQHPPPVPAKDMVKPRIRWTPELHQIFLDSIHQLGGHTKATPKGILKVMNVKNLSINNIKSHLQKFRLNMNLVESNQTHYTNTKFENHQQQDECIQQQQEQLIGTNNTPLRRENAVTQALLNQLEFQKQLHEQLKVQRELQMRIEKHGEYLKKIVEEQQQQNGQ